MRELIQLTDKILVCTQVENAIVLPHKNGRYTWGIGGVLSQNNEYLDASGFYSYWTRFGGYYKYNENKIKKIFDECIWFGLFTDHWGHFLVDNISRMWYVLENYNGQKIVYVSKSKKPIRGNFLRFLELMGISSENLVMIDEVTECSKLLIPEYSKSDRFYNKEYRSIFDKVVSNALSYTDSKNHALYGKKIYFSRENLTQAGSKEFGEKFIQDYFINNDYLPISPENLTLDEQISIWNNAAEVVSINGTIPLNICFCRNKSLNIVVLNKTRLCHDNLFDYSRIFDIKGIAYIDVFDARYSKFSKTLGDGPFILTVTPALLEYGEKRGFKKNYLSVNDNFINKTIKLKLVFKSIVIQKFKSIVKYILLKKNNH